MKTCFRCNVAKSLDEFYTHPRMRDGHLNKCKDCTRADVAERYRVNVSTPEGAERERRRGREKHRRLYSVGPNWQSPSGDAVTKKRANNMLCNAVRAGKIVRPKNCSECGDSGRIHGHHEDYSQPLKVDWLCSACHRRRHATYPQRIKRSA